MSTSIPPHSIHHLEDVGALFLSADRSLSAVRSELDALPLYGGVGCGSLGDGAAAAAGTGGGNHSLQQHAHTTLSSLRSIIDKTASAMRESSSLLLSSVEHNRLNTYPETTGRRWSGMHHFTNQQQLTMQQHAQSTALLPPPPPQPYAPQLAARRELVALEAEGRGGRFRQVHDAEKKKQREEALELRREMLRQNRMKIRRKHALSPIRSPSSSLLCCSPSSCSVGVVAPCSSGLSLSLTQPALDVTPLLLTQPCPLTTHTSMVHARPTQGNMQRTQIATVQEQFNNVRLDLGDEILRPEEKERERAQEAAKDAQAAKLIEFKAITPVSYACPLPALPPSSVSPSLLSPPSASDLLTAHLSLPAGDDAALRSYPQLLDQFSLHHIMVRKGRTMITPEFQSFQRKYAHMWGEIKTVLGEIEAFLRAYNVPLATVVGHSLVALASRVFSRPTLPELLSCLSEPDRWSAFERIPGMRYSMGGDAARQLAATHIQAWIRGNTQRRKYKLFLYRRQMVIRIQRAWRRYWTICKTREEVARRWELKLSNWKDMQLQWKLKWPSFSSKQRVIVHIPSISSESYQRQAFFNFSVKENSSLSRLFDLSDPNVSLVYVSPFPLTTDIENYYMKLLEIGGVENAAKRCKILYPDNYNYFPDFFSLSKLVLYSPKLCKKLRQYIRGRPACIVPNQVGHEDLQLAVHLHLPLYSPLPEVAQLFASKSGSKRLFALAGVAVPLGAHDIYDENDLFAYLSQLILSSLSTQRWLLKIDNESGGRGLAWLDVNQFPLLSDLRSEYSDHPARFSQPEMMANAQERLSALLKKSIKKIVLAQPDVWSNSPYNYLECFYRVGGVIEASPLHVIGSPSVNLLIDPCGGVHVLSSHDQVFSAPYVFGGCIFPSSAPAALIHQPAVSIGRACFKEGIIGPVSIDFLCWNDGTQVRVWAVDLNLRVSASQAAFSLFHFLMKGRYVYQQPVSGEKDKDKGDGVALEMQPPAKYLIQTHNGEEERHYASVPYLYQPQLSTFQFAAFFHSCRMRGIAFDIKQKKGSCFILLDSLASGTLGVLSIADSGVSSPLSSMLLLMEALSFIEEQVNQVKLGYGTATFDHEANLKPMSSSFKILIKAARMQEQLEQQALQR